MYRAPFIRQPTAVRRADLINTPVGGKMECPRSTTRSTSGQTRMYMHTTYKYTDIRTLDCKSKPAVRMGMHVSAPRPLTERPTCPLTGILQQSNTAPVLIGPIRDILQHNTPQGSKPDEVLKLFTWLELAITLTLAL